MPMEISIARRHSALVGALWLGSAVNCLAPCPSTVGPGLHTVRLDVPAEGGSDVLFGRAFDIFVASTLPLRNRRPAVLMWHGCGSDPEKFQDESEMNDRAAARRYYAVWPRGSSSNLAAADQHTCSSVGGTRCGWNSGWPGAGGCDTPSNPAPDDVMFASMILDWMEANLCVDMGKMFTVGFSNGAQMTYKLNCLLSGRLAGMMTLGASAADGVTPGSTGTCVPEKKLPTLNFCSSQDNICWGSDGSAVRQQLAAFATANGCTADGTSPPPTQETRLSETAWCDAATECDAESPVRGCGIEGLGHCWPQAGGGAGNDNCKEQDERNPDVSGYVLDFFSELNSAPVWLSWTVGAVAIVGSGGMVAAFAVFVMPRLRRTRDYTPIAVVDTTSDQARRGSVHGRARA
jgi:poly(3-hydroxybutyrate) depolymerase